MSGACKRPFVKISSHLWESFVADLDIFDVFFWFFMIFWDIFWPESLEKWTHFHENHWFFMKNTCLPTQISPQPGGVGRQTRYLTSLAWDVESKIIDRKNHAVSGRRVWWGGRSAIFEFLAWNTLLYEEYSLQCWLVLCGVLSGRWSQPSSTGGSCAVVRCSW